MVMVLRDSPQAKRGEKYSFFLIGIMEVMRIFYIKYMTRYAQVFSFQPSESLLSAILSR